MLCAKHGNDITDKKNKEQIGDIWLCRNAIWETQTVRDLVSKPGLLEEFSNQLIVKQKADALEQFIATKPTREQIDVFVKSQS